jgi:polysaccharide biosynthesis/export protein
MKYLITALLFVVMSPAATAYAAEAVRAEAARAADGPAATVLGAGDIVKITVFQNPDMTTEARISEGGTITFPLLGNVQVAGLTTAQAEQRIAEGLKKGGYVVQPQVNLFLSQLRSRQVSVLGQVSRPGKYPMEEASMKLVDLLAMAGGSTGADTVTIMRRNGSGYNKSEIDIPELFLKGDLSSNIEVGNGDIVYVQRAPMFYVYGEVGRPGAYKLERNMTVMQALASAGGITPRGTNRGIKVTRRREESAVQDITVRPVDVIQPDDVIYVRQSWF